MSNKYATFELDGTLKHRLIDGVHSIPEGAVPVDEGLWLRLIQETNCIWSIDVEGVISSTPLPPPVLISAAQAKRDSLLAEAALRVAPLQDAVDLGSATPDEAAALLAWKRFRIELSRIDKQSGFPDVIDWPVAPDESEA
ncbi:tail fiber assembly protein [Pseudomonas chlororaphis subsp. piscium]|nr:tail fiber assembly protein [Pseudomonas chlororaphis subsp. piscium]